MCGSEGRTVRANIEGAMLTVCNNCARYGSVVEKKEPSNRGNFRRRQPRQFEDTNERIVED